MIINKFGLNLETFFSYNIQGLKYISCKNGLDFELGTKKKVCQSFVLKSIEQRNLFNQQKVIKKRFLLSLTVRNKLERFLI
jgi:hypothetical protein